MSSRGPHRRQAPHRRIRRASATTLGAAGLVGLGHYLPSTCVLAQWFPTVPRATPGNWCRWKGSSDHPVVALTFDDGPSPSTTPRTLDILDELAMPATFFVLGALAETHSDLVSEIRRRGHAVASHGYQHEHHLLRSPAWISRDFVSAQTALGEIGVRPRWYRPPYGQLTTWTMVEARRHGMDVVLWSRWGREWAESSAEPVMDRMVPGLVPGAVLLLHDTDELCPVGTANRTHEVLPRLAAELERRKLRAATLDEVLDPTTAVEPNVAKAS